jgi:hypothetical protein
MDWMHLAQDRDQRRTLVNTVTNLRDPWNCLVNQSVTTDIIIVVTVVVFQGLGLWAVPIQNLFSEDYESV